MRDQPFGLDTLAGQAKPVLIANIVFDEDEFEFRWLANRLGIHEERHDWNLVALLAFAGGAHDEIMNKTQGKDEIALARRIGAVDDGRTQHIRCGWRSRSKHVSVTMLLATVAARPGLGVCGLSGNW